MNRSSNHPPSIPKNIPSSIQKRLNTISSSEEVFNEAKTVYQQALGEAGYDKELTYDSDQKMASRPTRKRRRRVVWYNPPYSKNVATNIGKEFFKLLQLHFPKQHPLHSIFNRNTVKLSYSYTTNMDNILKAHNAKILLKDINPRRTKAFYAHLACYCLLTLVHCYLILPFTLYIPSLLMLPSADEDNDDVIESFWLYIFSVFPSFVYYYLDR